MILTNCNQEAFYTLTRDGSLIQISNYPGSTKWLEAVDRTTEMLEKANADNSILYLYRGENRAMFFAKTGINNFAYDENPYYDRFFIIGSKAKSYLEHKNNDIPDLKQFDRVSKTHYIFHQLQEISKNPTFNRMLEYFNTSSSFADFKTTLDNIHDADHRLTIENLFLAFIHTLSSTPEDIHAHSVLISSSRNYEVAKSFSDTGFVIVFWLSNPIQNQAIDYYNIDIYNQLLSRYDLPVINKVH